MSTCYHDFLVQMAVNVAKAALHRRAMIGRDTDIKYFRKIVLLANIEASAAGLSPTDYPYVSAVRCQTRERPASLPQPGTNKGDFGPPEDRGGFAKYRKRHVGAPELTVAFM